MCINGVCYVATKRRGGTLNGNNADEIEFVAVPRAMFDVYCRRPFSELATMAADGFDGVCDAVALDRSIWVAEPIRDMKDKYQRSTFGGFESRARLSGYAVFRKGDRREFDRDDVAALLIQAW